MHVDPDLEAIAARLSSAELRNDDDLDPFDENSGPFVDLYSVAGLQRVFREYGVSQALEARGLGDHHLKITRDDPFRHRLEIVLGDGTPVLDMRLHLKETAIGADVGNSMTVVVVDWLLMQHPRRPFSPERPRFPGQLHPGTGLGRLVHNLMILLCRRLGRDGLVTVPERFHLAVLYRRIEYVAANPKDDVGVNAVLDAGDRAGVDLVTLAWALERGCVFDEDGRPFQYSPHTLIAPVSSRLEKALSAPSSSWFSALSSLSSHLSGAPAAPQLRVDLEALQRSLLADPVDGYVFRSPVVASSR